MKASDLKNSILQLAISGKLVPQDPKDEPASVLFEKIQTERKKLIKEGKIKVPKAFKEIGRINSTDAPFEIPRSWMWVRLGDVVDLYTGDSIPELVKISKYNGLKEGYDYIGTKDVSFENKIAYNNGVKIPYTEKGFRYSYANSILLCIEGGSAGRKIGLLDKQVCFGNKLCSIAALGFNHLYLYYFFQSDFFRQIFKEKNSGIIGGVSIKKFNNLKMPMPPLSEQKRIVGKIQELEPLLIRYDKAADELASLKNSFPDNLCKSILQYAIQGKLVSQNPEDESAKILLSRIQEEKNKLIKEGKLKPSKLPELNEPINSADMPFKIPNSWVWVSLGEIINLVSGQDMSPEKYNNRKIGIPYITGASNIEGEQVLINRWTSEPKSKSYKGDLLLTCKGTVGAMAFLEEEAVHIARQIMALRGNRYLNLKYIKIYLQTYIPTLQAIAKSLIPGIDRKSLLRIQIPLPPLAEQKRIVKKVEELNLFVNKLSGFIT